MTKTYQARKPSWRYVGPDGPLARLYRNDGRMYRFVGPTRRAKARDLWEIQRSLKKEVHSTSNSSDSSADEGEIGSAVVNAWGIPKQRPPCVTGNPPIFTGLTLLNFCRRDPSHPANLQFLQTQPGNLRGTSPGTVNTLREKAAAVAGMMLNDAEGLAGLPIPAILQKLVGCWHHRFYEERYTEPERGAKPEQCEMCCKESCPACCWVPEAQKLHWT